MAHEVLLKFFDAVVYWTRKQDLLPDNHYTVDGTLIDTWAYHEKLSAEDLPRKGTDNLPKEGGLNSSKHN